MNYHHKRKKLQEYLHGKDTPEGKELFEQWFHSEEKFQATPGKEKRNNSLFRIKKRLDQHIAADKKSSRFFVLRWAAVISLFVLSILGVYIVNQKTEWRTQYTEYNTKSKQQARLTLRDGTKVRLNENSTIRYPNQFLDNELRLVKLEGEAYFEVVKNPEKPFIIEAGGAKIQVIGTAFNVNSSAKDSTLTVAVTEGKVLLQSRNHEEEQILLTQNQIGVLSNEGLEREEISNVSNYLSWFSQRLIFENTPLSAVAQQLEHIYGRRIMVETGLEKRMVTLNTKRGSLESVLEDLAFTLRIKIQNTSQGFIIEDYE